MSSGNGFKAFKLSSSNIKPWDTEFEEIDGALLGAIDNVKSDRSQEDVLYELLLKYGLDLAIPVDERSIAGKTVYVIGAGALVVCLDSNIDLDVVKGIAALKTEIPMTYADMIQYIENSIDVIIQAGRHDGKRGITEFYLPGATEIGTSS